MDIKRLGLTICCLRKTYFGFKDTHRLKVNEWEKIFHTNGNQKKIGAIIHISDKIDFKLNTAKRQISKFYNDKRFIPPRRYHNYKYICTQYQKIQMYK